MEKKTSFPAIGRRLILLLAAAAVLFIGFLYIQAARPAQAGTAGTPAETPAAVPSEMPAAATITCCDNLIYNEQKGLAYDLYLPSSISSDRLFLFVHGGGWYSGSKEAQDYLARQYAREGFITATMNYSLLQNIDPEVTMDTILDEITECVSSIVDYLDAQSIPLSSMAIGGESAGGHISMLYAWSRTGSQPLPVEFILDFVGPVDFHPEAWVGRCTFCGTEASYTDLISCFLGQNVSYEELLSGSREEALAALDPTSYLTSDSAPILMNYGGQDTVISPAHREHLKQALEDAGVPYSFYLFPNSGHFLSESPDHSIYSEMFEESLRMLRQTPG